MSSMLCCQRNRAPPFSDVNIFAFCCYILNQIEDGVTVFCKETRHFCGPEKLLKTVSLQGRTLAVFLDLKPALFL